MKKILIFIFIFISEFMLAQNPHGDKLSVDCSKCHTSDTWSINLDSISFNHDSTNFQLNGQHRNMDCKSCHSSLIFNEVSSDCISCHSDIHQNTLGFDCASCHTENDWAINNIDELHENIGFPLLGTHNTISCNQCHTGADKLTFEPIGLDCVNCHAQDYDNSQNPDHNKVQFTKDCDKCHQIDDLSWNEVDQNISLEDMNHDFFLLSGVHETNDCNACHETDNYSSASSECVSCHLKDFDSSDKPNHIDLDLSTDCAVCHNTDSGWSPAEFPIHNQFYELTEAHIEIADECLRCHNPDYKNTSNTCNECHIDNYNNSQNPNHIELNFSKDCATCHTTDFGWSPAEFNEHDAYFILDGGHQNLDCNECHIAGNYKNTSSECYSCHSDDYNSTNFPKHTEDKFSTDCVQCHTVKPGWNPAEFAEHGDIFPLTLGHQGLECIQCHTSGTFEDISDECISCHTNDYNNSSNPNHKNNNYPLDCNQCHTTDPGWSPADFPIHNDFWVLDGAHSSVDCAECHNGDFNNTPNQCQDCHILDFNNSMNPNHKNNNYPLDCNQCHTTDPGWSPADFPIHNDFWVLDGAHSSVDCAECHNGDFNNTPNQCQDCHILDFNNSMNPNHKNNNYPLDCNQCHTTDPGWSPALFDKHNEFWVLDGAHIELACAECHNNGYSNTPSECFECHSDNYNNTTNPNHNELNIPKDCDQCHTTTPGWRPANFNIHDNYWPLTGAHLNTECSSCHNQGYSGTPSECNACHINEYNNTTDPNHLEAGFPTDCASCHTTDAWEPSTFDHNNYWELTGAHLNTECNSCHENGYAGTPTNCDACHIDDYNNSSNPNHQNSNYPTDCDQCHTTDPGWSPADFPIHNDFWVLDGAHTSVDCAECHNGDFNNTPNQCEGCHMEDYNNTTDPDHESAGFPTDCAECHTTDAWEPSTFDHDGMYFPIYSGEHEGEWNQCSDCHYDNSDYSLFTCTLCHPNSEMDNEHSGVNGYSNDPNACYACHPDGTADD